MKVTPIVASGAKPIGGEFPGDIITRQLDARRIDAAPGELVRSEQLHMFGDLVGGEKVLGRGFESPRAQSAENEQA